MITNVTDTRSNKDEQIVNAANVLGDSPQRKMVFEAIYRTKQKIKTRSEIENMTGLSNVRVLQEGKKLADHGIVKQIKVNRQAAYEKDPFFTQYKQKILKLAGNTDKIDKIATKSNPKVRVAIKEVIIKYPKPLLNVKHLTIDDIESFAKTKKIRKNTRPFVRIDENKFKIGVQKIIGEKGKFKDWGGEKNDLFTTKVRVNSKRHSAVFAFKGKGKSGILKPNMMGKNGDQIPRLFQNEADIFILQYWGQIHQSVYELMYMLAIAKSVLSQKRIYYCVIDGDDTARLCEAYLTTFGKVVK